MGLEGMLSGTEARVRKARNRKAGRIGPYVKAAVGMIVGWIAVALLKLTRLLDRRLVATFAAFMMRNIGPWLPERRVGRNNLRGRVPGKVAGRDRGDTDRDLGQSLDASPPS